MIYFAWAVLLFGTGFLVGCWLTEFLVKAEYESKRCEFEKKSRTLAFLGCGSKEKP